MGFHTPSGTDWRTVPGGAGRSGGGALTPEHWQPARTRLRLRNQMRIGRGRGRPRIRVGDTEILILQPVTRKIWARLPAGRCWPQRRRGIRVLSGHPLAHPIHHPPGPVSILTPQLGPSEGPSRHPARAPLTGWLGPTGRGAPVSSCNTLPL